jgi:hypothetical protein
MEITCTRCHQTVEADNCYCPNCGLPRLVYSADGATALAQPEIVNGVVRDASTVDWKPAMRIAILLAVPAGLLSSVPSPLSSLGIVWMTAASVWAVLLYMRSQRPAWITIGAGARIGLVTGLLGAWLAFGASGCGLLVQRFVLHQPGDIDGPYKTLVVDTFQDRAQQSIAGMAPADAAQVQAQFLQIQAWMLSPDGHAAIWAFGFAFNSALLLFFAVGGGALGARLAARTRRTEI